MLLSIFEEYFNVGILPPANEVWGKVIFSQVCVIQSVHRGVGLYPGGICLQEDLHGGGGVWAYPLSWILWDTINERAVRILLESILVVYLRTKPHEEEIMLHIRKLVIL